MKLTNWFKQYIEKFAVILKFLQLKKTQLLHHASKSKNVKKSYFSRIKFVKFIAKANTFNVIQKSLFISIYLIYFDNTRQLYIDLDVSKEMNINSVIYHVIDDSDFLIYSFRKSVQSIMFLNRFLSLTKSKYRSTELKLTELIWIFRKTRHLINFTVKSTIIYIDHEAIFAIVKQISLLTFSTNKLNFRFVRVFDYIQRFDLIIKHKSERLHLISNALFTLSTMSASDAKQLKDEEFDVLFMTSLVKMISSFKKKLIKKYLKDST